MGDTDSSRVSSEVLGGLVLKRIEPLDAEAALALSDEARWNQTVEDWRFMLTQGRATGLWEPGVGWAASSLILPQARGLAWISMVLVSGRHRRKGLGTALLRRCIDDVRASGAVPGLDATELGRPVYLPLGFSDVFGTSRWRVDLESAADPLAPSCVIRRMTEGDLPAVVAFDAARAAASRGHVLRYFFGRVRDRACLAEADGRIVGYALGRPGRRTAQIGPVVAERPDIAVALVARMLAFRAPVILDVPDTQEEFVAWLRDLGAVRERGFTRMTLGRFAGLEDASCIYGLAGPELG